MSFPEIEVVKVEKIDIQDGDVLAVYLRGMYSVERMQATKEMFVNAFLPKKVKVVLVNGDAADLRVLRTE
jgi:hypothetical protein